MGDHAAHREYVAVRVAWQGATSPGAASTTVGAPPGKKLLVWAREAEGAGEDGKRRAERDALERAWYQSYQRAAHPRRSRREPHLVAKFKMSNDRSSRRRSTDVVGLYLNPPDRALVCVSTRRV